MFSGYLRYSHQPNNTVELVHITDLTISTTFAFKGRIRTDPHPTSPGLVGAPPGLVGSPPGLVGSPPGYDNNVLQDNASKTLLIFEI